MIDSARCGVSYGASESDPVASPALAEAAGLGIGWVRLGLYWNQIEPVQGRLDWSVPDALIAEANRLGLHVLGQLFGTPEWQTTAPADATSPRHHYPPLSLSAYGRWVKEAVSRYRDVVQHWEVWNEPDLALFWPSTPTVYALLLATACIAIKDTDWLASVVLGGLALGGAPRNPSFLPEILNDRVHPAANSFDIANLHCYGPLTEADRRTRYVRDALAAAPAASPIWVTETGYASDPVLQQQRGYTGGEPSQAAWLQTALPALLTRVERVFWFDLFDSPKAGPPYRSHGLFRADLGPKPASDAYRKLLVR
jgi:polysaccharide biosynthesis protein PslG